MRLVVMASVLALVVLLAAVLVYARRPGVAAFAVRGIDVSHHQGEIDWARVAEHGVHFAFIKATEGRDHLDTRFRENWQAAARSGVVRGAYHFFTFCSPGNAQADHFLAVVPPTPGVLPPVLDVEFAGNCRAWSSIEEIRADLQVMLDRLEEAWGLRPLLYITNESERRIIEGHFDRYPIWIRNVYWRPPLDKPTWLFWQYTDEGRVDGIATPVDQNVYRGRPDELSALLR
jgi:lysozyme